MHRENLLPIRSFVRVVTIAALAGVAAGASAQDGAVRPAGPATPAAQGVAAPPTSAAPAPPPSDYRIGANDILVVRVWEEERIAGKVVVRPDGKVSLPMVNEVQAGGLTVDQFRMTVAEAAKKFVQAPTVDVQVEQINSRVVYAQGEVAKRGPYPLGSNLTVMQLIALAGGPTEYADKGNVTVIRTENGKTRVIKVNYSDIMKGKNLQQNVELMIGDIVTIGD